MMEDGTAYKTAYRYDKDDRVTMVQYGDADHGGELYL